MPRSQMAASKREERVYCVTVVFDLDYTLWPFYCDTEEPPFKRVGSGKVHAADGRVLELYPGVREMLDALQHTTATTAARPKRVELTLRTLSRTDTPHDAERLLELFGIRSYFAGCDYDRCSKAPHVQWYFAKQQRECEQRRERGEDVVAAGVVLIDDESRNISDVRHAARESGDPLFAVLVSRGATLSAVSTAVSNVVGRAVSQATGTPDTSL